MAKTYPGSTYPCECEWGNCREGARIRRRTWLLDGRIYDNAYCLSCAKLAAMCQRDEVIEEVVDFNPREPMRRLAFPPGSPPTIAIEVGLHDIRRELDQWPDTWEHRCLFDFSPRWWIPTCNACGESSVLYAFPMRLGGVVARYPRSILYLDSI